MNPIIFILLCFAALGLFDKMFKNRLGLATSFDRGIITMGDFMMSVGGFYCIAIAFLNGHATLFENKEMIISSLLAPDLDRPERRLLRAHRQEPQAAHHLPDPGAGPEDRRRNSGALQR